MKTKIPSFCATLLLAAAVCLNAEEPPKPKPGSTEFEKIKTMVGTWTGKVDMGQGPIEMTAQYRLLAGGTVLEERVFAGTPQEMITMFYDKDGKLALTHYCVMGNRPSMFLQSSDAKTFKFDFDPSCGINSKKESHMHALTMNFEDSDTISMSCSAIIDGKEMPNKPVTMKRVK